MSKKKTDLRHFFATDHKGLARERARARAWVDALPHDRKEQLKRELRSGEYYWPEWFGQRQPSDVFEEEMTQALAAMS